MAKWINKFKYAANGLAHAYITESTFVILSWFFVTLIALGIICAISITEWMFIILFCCLALVAELFNTIIERICDVFTQGWIIKEIGIIKDLCAGAVLILSMCSLIVALIVFVPKIF